MKSKMLIGVFLVAIIIGGAFLFGAGGFNIAQGVNSMSLSKVELKSDFDPLNGDAFLYTFSLGGLSQTMNARIDPGEAASSLLGDSEAPAKTFSMTVDVNSQECVYDVKESTAQDVVLMEYIDTGFSVSLPTCRDRASECPDGKTQFEGQGGYFQNYLTCYQLCLNTIGETGFFDNPNLDTEYTVRVDNGESSAQQTFSTLDDDFEGRVGSNVWLTWQGNLDRGVACPSQSEYRPAYVNGGWKVTDSNYYNDWRDTFIAFTAETSGGFSDKQAELARVNDLAIKATNGVTFYNGGEKGSLIKSTELAGAELRVGLNQLIASPTLSAYVKADWIGIETPVGMPAIIDMDTSCFATGGDGNIEVGIMNEGDGYEQFNVYADCGSTFDNDINRQIGLDAGERDIVLLPISADVSERTIEQCTVMVEGKLSVAQATIDVCADPQVLCQAGTISCYDGNVVMCNNAGSGYEIIQICEAGCESDNQGIPQCKELDAKHVCSNGELVDDESQCNSKFRLIPFAISLLLAIAGGMFVGTRLDKNFSFKNGKVAAWIIGIIVGVLIFIIVAAIISYVVNLFETNWILRWLF